jgi:hypothetical protein
VPAFFVLACHGLRSVTCVTSAVTVSLYSVPKLKAQDNGQATKTHSNEALDRPHDPRSFGDPHRRRGVDWCSRTITGLSLVDALTVTGRGLKNHAD